jgi:hypothetical protein
MKRHVPPSRSLQLWGKKMSSTAHCGIVEGRGSHRTVKACTGKAFSKVGLRSQKTFYQNRGKHWGLLLLRRPFPKVWYFDMLRTLN